MAGRNAELADTFALVFVCGEQCQLIAHGTPAFVAVGMDMPCVQFFQDTAAALVNVRTGKPESALYCCGLHFGKVEDDFFRFNTPQRKVPDTGGVDDIERQPSSVVSGKGHR